MSFMRKLFGRKTDVADETDSASPQAEDPSEHQERGDGQHPERNGGQGPEGSGVSASESEADTAVRSVSETAPAEAQEPISDQGRPVYELGQTVQRSVALRVGYASDVGQLRPHNEDSLIAFQGIRLGIDTAEPFGFFVVTDGMGGHQAGEVASSMAARLVTHQVLSKVYLPFLLDEAPSADMDPLPEVLKDAVKRANDKVFERVPGGGTTLTCALILGRRAFIAHVGDSRAYLLTGREMRQLTQDHSLVGRLIELGELSPEEAIVHPQRHVLYRAVGQGDNLDIDTYQQPLPPGSRLLMCSDGLSGMVPEEEIGMIIASAATPQEACYQLVKAANRAGGPDNITAVIIETPLD